ncbi:MAG: hypothetical protein V1487_03530 [bacterium]
MIKSPKYLLALILLLGLGIWFFSRLSTSPQVAQVGSNVCVSNVTTFSASDACGLDGYKQYSFTCGGDERPLSILSPSVTCISFISAYKSATENCGCAPKPSVPPSRPPKPSPVIPPFACPEDVRICPDGTTVGRTGPNCQFVCPSTSPTPTPPSISPPNPSPSKISCLIQCLLKDRKSYSVCQTRCR